MTLQQLLEKKQTQKIGKEPVVVFPLKDWQVIETMIEEYEVDTRAHRESITSARAEVREGKLYELNITTGRFRKMKE